MGFEPDFNRIRGTLMFMARGIALLGESDRKKRGF